MKKSIKSVKADSGDKIVQAFQRSSNNTDGPREGSEIDRTMERPAPASDEAKEPSESTRAMGRPVSDETKKQSVSDSTKETTCGNIFRAAEALADSDSLETLENLSGIMSGLDGLGEDAALDMLVRNNPCISKFCFSSVDLSVSIMYAFV